MSLILRRREAESVVCLLPDGERITITVEESGANVKLSFDAPVNVKILRSELLLTQQEVKGDSWHESSNDGT